MSNTAVVVGAGIGGLAVARGLLKVGWSVQVLERDLAPSPAGTALGMWPEAMRALDRLGVGPAVRARASLQRSARILRPDGSTMVSLGPDRAAHLISRRGLLHTLADDLPQGTVLTGSPVLHPDELLPVDIIVAADGLHSAIRRSRWAGDPRPSAPSPSAAPSRVRRPRSPRPGVPAAFSGSPQQRRHHQLVRLRPQQHAQRT